MKRLSLSICLLSALGITVSFAANPIPIWYPGPTTTQQGYIFDSNNLTPPPSTQDNPYGTPLTTINLQPLLASGWQSNAPGSIDLNGVNGDGAWDIGTSSTGEGTILTQLNFAATTAAPGTYYTVEFQVYAVAYKGITAVPHFYAPGLTPLDLVGTQSTVATDPGFPGATWEGLTWTGYFDNVTSNSLTFGIQAPTTNTSVVDTFEIFTRYTLVPEPSSAVILLGSVFAFISRRRRA